MVAFFFIHPVHINCIRKTLFSLLPEVNTCEPNPCRNDGVCTELKNGEFECTCKKGHFGDKCQGRLGCTTSGISYVVAK